MKKSLSVLLAVIMVFSAIPLGGLSEYIENVDFSFISTKASAASTSDLHFELTFDGKSYYLTYCNEAASGTINIPSKYKGKPVIGIECGAFENLKNITKVTIPDSVEAIGANAFCGCTGLKTITIGNNVTSIQGRAFYDTAYYNNSSNWENGVLYIGNYIIGAKKDISGSYTIKQGTKCIAVGAFLGCSYLKSVTIPNSVISINDYAFCDCSNLKSALVPESVKNMRYAFGGCDKLTIYGKSGSAAQTYAKENNIPFKKILSSSVKVKLGEISNTSTGVKITWSGLSGAEKYTIYRKSGTSSYKAIKTVSSSTKSYTDTTAKSGTKYTYTVKAKNAVSKSGYDKTGLSKLYLATPTLKTSNTSKGISVKWNKITGAKGYYVYRKAGSGSWTKVKDVTSGSTVSFTDKNVKSGAKYCYKVKAYNGKTYSGGKSSDVLMYLKAVTLSSASSGKTGITVKWESVSSARGYYVYCQTGSGSFKKIATVTGGSTVKYLDKSAEKGTTYTYYVKAYNGSYKGSYANKLSCKDKY